jgi:16S rRNA C967 or C1407 C5-methylase (RsmB/RsmF family)
MIKDTFRVYLEEAIGRDNALVAFSAFEKPASVAVRQNPFKKCHSFDGEPVLWSKWGQILGERPVFTLDPHFHAGAYYVQDSSSMFVGEVFRQCLDDIKLPQGRSLRVLDLCAAPGGKTTDLAASLREKCGDAFLLVANEVMKQRA